jgi:hypothetical protein
MAPAKRPAAVSSLARIIYWVFAPPQLPGKNETPTELDVEAPRPTPAEPALVKLISNVVLLPWHTVVGEAVAVAVIPDKGLLTTTLTLLTAWQSPSIPVTR